MINPNEILDYSGFALGIFSSERREGDLEAPLIHGWDGVEEIF